MASPVGKKVARWQDEPVPWEMVFRGFFPRCIRGESVYLSCPHQSFQYSGVAARSFASKVGHFQHHVHESQSKKLPNSDVATNKPIKS